MRIRAGTWWVVPLMVCVAAVGAWASLCQGEISVGDVEIRLLGEQLLLDAEGGYLLVGYYRVWDGTTVWIDCSGSPSLYVTSGTSV